MVFGVIFVATISSIRQKKIKIDWILICSVSFYVIMINYKIPFENPDVILRTKLKQHVSHGALRTAKSGRFHSNLPHINIV